MLRSVVTASRALEILGASDRPVGVSELAREVGVSVSTAHRVLATLTATGFARRGDGGRYRLGPAAVRLASHASTPLLLRDAARPVLRWLAATSGETVHLAVLDGTSVVTIDHATGPRGVASAHAVGGRVPAHATAVGLALLAHHPEVVEAVIAEGLEPWTTSTIADAATLRRRLAEIRRRGYAVNRRSWLEWTAGVAAPVLLASGVAAASIGISGPAERLARPAAIGALGPLARAAATAVAARLAESPPMHRVR